MRRRNIQVIVRLNENESKQLKQKAKKCNLNQTAYIRHLITGFVPREAPSLDYFKLINEIRMIENNVNQIAYVANATGHIGAEALRQEVSNIRRDLLKIQEAVLLPDKME